MKPGRVVIYERYQDEAAFQAHRSSEHLERLGLGQIIPMFRSRQVTTAVVHGGAALGSQP